MNFPETPLPGTADEVWYRYDDVQFAAPLNEYGEPQGIPGRFEVVCRTYAVVKHTPKGVWLSYSPFKPHAFDRRDCRFVLHSAHRRYACATKLEAATSFWHRKHRQLGIYNARARQAEKALTIATRLIEEHKQKEIVQ